MDTDSDQWAADVELVPPPVAPVPTDMGGSDGPDKHHKHRKHHGEFDYSPIGDRVPDVTSRPYVGNHPSSWPSLPPVYLQPEEKVLDVLTHDRKMGVPSRYVLLMSILTAGIYLVIWSIARLRGWPIFRQWLILTDRRIIKVAQYLGRPAGCCRAEEPPIYHLRSFRLSKLTWMQRVINKNVPQCLGCCYHRNTATIRMFFDRFPESYPSNSVLASLSSAPISLDGLQKTAATTARGMVQQGGAQSLLLPALGPFLFLFTLIGRYIGFMFGYVSMSMQRGSLMEDDWMIGRQGITFTMKGEDVDDIQRFFKNILSFYPRQNQLKSLPDASNLKLGTDETFDSAPVDLKTQTAILNSERVGITQNETVCATLVHIPETSFMDIVQAIVTFGLHYFLVTKRILKTSGMIALTDLRMLTDFIYSDGETTQSDVSCFFHMIGSGAMVAYHPVNRCGNPFRLCGMKEWLTLTVFSGFGTISITPDVKNGLKTTHAFFRAWITGLDNPQLLPPGPGEHAVGPGEIDKHYRLPNEEMVAQLSLKLKPECDSAQECMQLARFWCTRCTSCGISPPTGYDCVMLTTHRLIFQFRSENCVGMLKKTDVFVNLSEISAFEMLQRGRMRGLRCCSNSWCLPETRFVSVRFNIGNAEFGMQFVEPKVGLDKPQVDTFFTGLSYLERQQEFQVWGDMYGRGI